MPNPTGLRLVSTTSNRRRKSKNNSERKCSGSSANTPTASTPPPIASALSPMLSSLVGDLQRLEQLAPLAVAAIHRVTLRQIAEAAGHEAIYQSGATAAPATGWKALNRRT